MADIEGETDDLAQLRQEMVDFAHNRGEGHALKDLQVALTMQVEKIFSDGRHSAKVHFLNLTCDQSEA